MPKGKIDRLIYRLELRHHRKPFPGSWFFCSLWDWRVGVPLRMLIWEDWTRHVLRRDPYADKR